MARRTVEPVRPSPMWRRGLLIGAVFAVIAGVATGLIWWRSGEEAEPPRARQYQDFTACLLTGKSGVTEPTAEQVWAGMQEASAESRIRVQFLAVRGPQTPEAARPLAASLAQSRCQLVLAVGAAPTTAIEATAPSFPDTRFVTVGGQGDERVNLSNLEPGGDVQRQVAELIKAVSPVS